MKKRYIRDSLKLLRAEPTTGTKRQIGATLGTSVGIQLVNVFTGVLLARSLGVEDRGALAVLLLWTFLLSSIATLGVPDAVAYANARALAPSKVVFGTALAIGMAETLLVAPAVFVALSLIAPDAEGMAVATVVLTVPLYISSGFAAAALQARPHLGGFNAARLTIPLTTATVLFAFVATASLTVRTAAVAYLITYAAAAIVGGFLASRGAGRLGLDRGVARTLIGYGSRSHVSFLATTLNERLDQLLISVFLSMTSLGLYVVAGTLTAGSAIVGSSVALVALPRIARAADDLTESLRLCRRFAVVTLVVVVVVTAPVAALAPWLLATLFGDAFAAGSTACRILLAAAVFLAMSRLLGSMLKALGRPLLAGEGDAAGLAVTIVALALLLPVAGIVGAAVASLLAYAVACSVMARRLATALDCSLRDFVLVRRTDPAGVVEGSA